MTKHPMAKCLMTKCPALDLVKNVPLGKSGWEVLLLYPGLDVSPLDILLLDVLSLHPFKVLSVQFCRMPLIFF
jgi:hypothetical protein